MADASFTWTSFLGGEWSTYYQGRTEDPRYKTAMNLCYNGFPIEEGAWTRRPGFRFCGYTYQGRYARLFGYSFTETLPYTIELTDSVLRLWSGPNLVLDPSTLCNISSISTNTPVRITVDAAISPAPNASYIMLMLNSGPATGFATLRNRQLFAALISTGVYELYDAATGLPVSGADVYWDGTVMTGQMAQIWQVETPFGSLGDQVSNSQDNVRVIQFGSTAVLVNLNDAPTALTLISADESDGRYSQFAYSTPQFIDGPYYDPVAGQTATPSGISGSVTFTLANGFGPRNAATAADIGKSVRFFNEPLLFDSTHTYAVGDSVTGVVGGTNLYFTASQPSTGVDPSTNPAYWQLNSGAAVWAWGTITAVPGFNQITVLLATDLLYTTTSAQWRLGLWGGVDGWPKCGTFHGGRLCFGYKNRFITSQPNDPYNMSPTEVDGTVTDASGINYQIQSGVEDNNDIQWMYSDLQGIVMGTLAGEWLMQASNLNDPITVTTADARKVTKYGCGFIQPLKTGLSLVFVQKYGRKLMEFLADVFTGKFVAPNLTTAAKHLTTNGIEEIAYCEELTPIIWMRDAQELLRGMTYRRTSAWSTEPPAFVGWHQHVLGNNLGVVSITTTPSQNGTLDTLSVVLKDGSDVHAVCQMAKQFEVNDALSSAWYLDYATSPTAAHDDGTGSGLLLYGYNYLAGQTVSVWAGGLNAGSYVVSSDGIITVPYQSDPDGTLTLAYLQGLHDTSASATSLYSTATTTPARSPASATVGSFSGAVDHNFFTDFALNRFITYGTTNFTTFNTVTRGIVAGPTAITSVIPSSTLWGGAVGSDSFFYIQAGLVSRPILYKLDPSGWGVLGSFGDGASDLTSGPRGIQYSHAMCSAFANGTDFVVSVNEQTTGLQVVNGSTMQWAAFQGTASIKSWISRGFVGSVGTVFTLDQITGTHGTAAVLRQLSIGGLAGTYSTAVNAFIAGLSYDYGSMVLDDGQTFVSLTTSNSATPTGVSGVNWGLMKGAYNGGHTYAQYDCVTEEGVIYYSVAGSNVGNDPKFNNDYEGPHDWTIVTNPYIKQNTVATLTPSQVDATWTHFFTDDMGYDRADGNVIVKFSTDDSVTTKHYITKVNTSTGAIMWATPVVDSASIGLYEARIQGGILGYLADDGTTYSINTATGAAYITPFATPGLGLSNVGQVMDSQTGTLIGNYNYNSGTTGAPTPLSGTPGTFSTTWAIYTPGTAFSSNTQSAATNAIPVVVGYPYLSKGQLLRPGEAAQAGTQNGPPMGKTRRGHMFSALFANCITGTVTFGTDFTRGHAVKFATTGGTAYNHSTLFNGVFWDVLDDGYSFDSMIAWQVTGPYPATICSVGGFLHTQDR